MKKFGLRGIWLDGGSTSFKKIKSLKEKGSTVEEPLKKTRIEEPVPTVPIQIVPTPEFDVAAPSLAIPDEVALSASLERGEVVEKRKKKKKNFIAKKVRRKVGHSSGESSGQDQDSLDDQKVIHSLIQGSLLLYIANRMVRKKNAERFDESFTAYFELGHYLFAHSRIADLCQIEVSKVL
ncbi:hypothetical protein COCNU_02G009360 [Cocos nucifera]|uniref:Uncharacterized protein n=1 Tax=Cocos nucifera TaxID=13894 RepID=A0A8K0HZ79_COCNU|nr:hypothetical protein COCNU_02G009360 [Cocos nucifera]